ncbi:MAG: adenylosuccinate synthase [Nitrospinae bacterium]|nr:adenylosuccinate synthase [Nitrospinota bacterium]
MPVTVVVGAQWGDEGKGKVVDMLAESMDVIARYQGGANAGHTVVVGAEEYILHLIPSGILHKGKTCVIGAGVVIDPEALLLEIDELEKRGFTVKGSLVVSGRSHLIMPYHKLMDQASEKNSGAGKIGTTGRGIGPAYADKASRTGLRMLDLFKPDYFKTRLTAAVTQKNALLEKLYGQPPVDPEPIFEQYMKYAARLKDYVSDCGRVIRKAIADGKNVLAEGAQGTMLDIDQGTYPFVTSSPAAAGGACTGLGIPPRAVQYVIGIMKAYTTRVGEGPFPSELCDGMGEDLRKIGHEFGATTGRPRRCGWLDAVVGRYAVEVNGITGITLTKLDVLDDFDELKICVAYEVDGETITHMPEDTDVFARCKPVYETMKGWKTSTSGVSRYEDLPLAAKNYIARVEELTGAPVSIISTGQDRAATILR